MDKIQRLSRYFCVVATAALVVLPFMLLLFWWNAPDSFSWGNAWGLSFSFLPHGFKVMHTLSGLEKMFGFLISLIPVGVNMLILYFLIQLFRLYARGSIFAMENIRYIRQISCALLVGQGLNLIYQALITLVITWHNPHGHRYIALSLDGYNIGIVVMALVILLIAWIMEEGRQLNQDNLRMV